MSILKNLKSLLNKAKNIENNIFEWSVGDLGNQIEKNITDKVSLKTIAKDDILVVAQTAISSLTSEQDSDGDVQLKVTDIKGTTISAEASNGDVVELDILDMRILEAYSMLDSKVTIFVIDLPAKVKAKEF